MTTVTNLPLGVRLNNPGCLRRPTRADSRRCIVDGYQKFDSWNEGCTNLAQLIWNYYHLLELRTAKQFVSRYAPPSENDTLAYIRFVSHFMLPEKNFPELEDLHLDEGSNAALMMQAISVMECGYRSTIGIRREPWISAADAFHALAIVGKFR